VAPLTRKQGSRPSISETYCLSDLTPQEKRRWNQLAHYVAARAGTLTFRAAMERLQGLLQVALAASTPTVPGGVLDACFYERFRASLLAAGALESDLEAAAYLWVCIIVDRTHPGSDERNEQLELIAQHMAGTDMTVRIGDGDTTVRVEFTDRPMRH
jgi:hypothetical protein